jgi:hypothetical protein
VHFLQEFNSKHNEELQNEDKNKRQFTWDLRKVIDNGQQIVPWAWLHALQYYFRGDLMQENLPFTWVHQGMLVFSADKPATTR